MSLRQPLRNGGDQEVVVIALLILHIHLLFILQKKDPYEAYVYAWLANDLFYF
jgi:hypothetical protein